jgi:hypothetical protein
MGCRQSRSPATRAGPARSWRNPFIPGRAKLRGRRETTPSAKIEAVGRGSSAMPSPKIHIKPIKMHGISLRSTWGPAFRWHTPLLSSLLALVPRLACLCLPFPFSRKSSASRCFGTQRTRTLLRTRSCGEASFGQSAAGIVKNPGIENGRTLLERPKSPLSRIVSTSLGWRARRYDGEHSGSQYEHERCSIVS